MQIKPHYQLHGHTELTLEEPITDTVTTATSLTQYIYINIRYISNTHTHRLKHTPKNIHHLMYHDFLTLVRCLADSSHK